MKKTFLALYTLTFSVAGLAGAEPVQPKASWVVDFADAQCVASRNYGTADDPLLLVLKAPPAGDVLQIAIVTKGVADSPKQMDGEIVLDQQPPIAASLLQFGIKQENHTVITTNMPRDRLAQMRTASSMRIHARDAQGGDIQPGSRIGQLSALVADYNLKLTQVPALLDLLDKCALDLRRVWNVEDGDGKPALVQKRPSGELRQAFSSGDYPDVALLKEQEGSIRVAILVDEQGKVSDCTVIKTSGVASLDAQSCAVIQQRAKLKPAVGLDGKPAKGSLAQTITWAIER
jgi:TonB family protein